MKFLFILVAIEFLDNERTFYEDKGSLPAVKAAVMAVLQQLQQMVADFVSLVEHLDVAKPDAVVLVAAARW